MSATSGTRKENVKGDGSKQRSGYLTTTEFAKLFGVSRFTIINWAKRGRIKSIRTAGRHYRIPASEALSLLRTFEEKKETSSDEECRNCLSDDEENKHQKGKREKFLYNFGYGIGRGVHILKERR
ncbi:MAG TPA: excisionase family DNA-binding protein [Planctomycetes bacterium]|nr:excisionase family DNA-binding protein [Planctomycetota bacterium]